MSTHSVGNETAAPIERAFLDWARGRYVSPIVYQEVGGFQRVLVGAIPATTWRERLADVVATVRGRPSAGVHRRIDGTERVRFRVVYGPTGEIIDFAPLVENDTPQPERGGYR